MKRGGTQSESAELQVFLFDHAILMVKQKSKNEQYKVYRKVRFHFFSTRFDTDAELIANTARTTRCRSYR